MNCQVSQLPEPSVTLWFCRPALKILAIEEVRRVPRNYVEGEAIEVQRTVVCVRHGGSRIEVYEHDEIGRKLVTVKVLIAGALRQVNAVSFCRCSGFHLNPQVASWVVCFDDDIASGKVCSEAARFVGADLMHPAFRENRGFTYVAVRP